MTIRPYAPADRAACLAIFDGHVPAYFAAADRPDFAGFLERPPGPFLVVEDGGVVACGGWYVEKARAGLAWGMVERSRQAKGLGGALLLERLRQIRDDGRAEVVDFVVAGVTADGFGRGRDRVEMESRL